MEDFDTRSVPSCVTIEVNAPIRQCERDLFGEFYRFGYDLSRHRIILHHLHGPARRDEEPSIHGLT